ncbi:thermonuclease domain protein (plasmid) [Clostridium botulinum]|uniref:Thermonuclease domain protein n=2 Tax=Clostridium botulinum TaxID=1491 RepID=A0A1L7JNQ1_CLOBO|nr:thermonuclease domain protein [Clostridium botulinum]
MHWTILLKYCNKRGDDFMGIKKFIPIILITVLLVGCQDINEATKLSQDVAKDNVSIINNIKSNNYVEKII